MYKEDLREYANKDAIHMLEGRPGGQLPNGATILKHKLTNEAEFGNEYVVLCVAPNSHLPFVTWMRYVGIELKSDGNYQPCEYTVWGNYYSNLEDALSDFEKRSSDQLARHNR
jgi:hypothetical protein